MAQLLRPADAGPSGRISQLLPTVKCSTCSQPVALDQLGDHVCAPPPKSPAASLFPRLQNILSPVRSQSPASSVFGSSISSAHSHRSRTSTASRDTRSSYNHLPLTPDRSTVSSVNTLRFPPDHGGNPTPSTPTSARSTGSIADRPRFNSSASSDGLPPPSGMLSPTPTPGRTRTPSNALAARTRTPSNNSSPATPGRSRAPSNASSVRSHYEGPAPPRPPSGYRRPSNGSIAHPSTPSPRLPPPSPYASPRIPGSPYSPCPSPASPAPSQYAPPLSPHPEEIDTKTGGEAGMAGVGRRGFAAAARAAMFAGAASHTFLGPAPIGMDGRRPNAPGWLDIGNVTSGTYPGSASPHSLSPHSPRSPYASPSPGAMSTRDSSATITLSPLPPTSPTLHDPASPPNSIPFPIKPPPPVPFMGSGDPKTPTTPMTPHLPFFEKYKERMPTGMGITVGGDADADADASEAVRIPMSPTGSSEYGLAYADSDTDNDAPMPYTKLPPSETHSAGGGLDHAMEMLLRSPTSSSVDDEAGLKSPTSSASSSLSPRSRPVKLPTRSHTTPTQRESTRALPGRRGGTISGALQGVTRKAEGDAEGAQEKDEARERKASKRERICVRCTKKINDGRWIRVESGKGVLCDACWKGMYLPKKPFPDRTFYVFDGKPFCAYHYHEANESLCSAPSCGQPIEGPCAVSHAGARYHPEHLTCEYEGEGDDDASVSEYDGGDGEHKPRRCTERLVEYWEVEGRMLCECHMRRAVGSEYAGSSIGRGDNDRAMKRVTLFIDLAGMGESGLL
ncbi:hypothetical protein DENSPDRAFT_864256 [Dentipellis sp. KUC8613]|nr:hypothetical protein DENSPDRAFT_864256 [Dentipellis sp. KUC8613]